MTWSGAWSRWRPAQPERRGSAIAAAIALTVRAHAIASMQARQPKRDSRLKACSALKAPRVKAQRVALLTSVLRGQWRDRTVLTLRIEAQTTTRSVKQNRRLRVDQDAVPNSTDLGCPRSPTMLLESRAERQKMIEIRVAVVGVAELAGCNCRRVFISSRREITKDGLVIVPRRQFLRGLASLAVCAPAVVRASSLMGVSARFRVFRRASSAVGDPLRTLSPCCSTRWSANLPKRCSAPRVLSAEAETSRPGPQPGRRGSQDYSVVGAANVVRASRFAAQTARRSARRSPCGSFFDVWMLPRRKF